MSRETRRIGEFVAVDDDGERYTVLVFQDFIEHRPLSGRAQWVPGLKELRLADGMHVNQIDPETFKIVETDQIIRKFR